MKYLGQITIIHQPEIFGSSGDRHATMIPGSVGARSLNIPASVGSCGASGLVGISVGTWVGSRTIFQTPTGDILRTLMGIYFCYIMEILGYILPSNGIYSTRNLLEVDGCEQCDN